MWKNILDWVRSQMTIWRMHISLWIPKATNTHSDCVILIAFPLHQFLQNAYLIWLYTFIVFLVITQMASVYCAVGTEYTGCHRRKGPNFGRVFLMLNYTDITQNTYIQSWTVTEIMAREFWNFDSWYTLTDYQIHIETGRNMWFL